MYLKIVKITDKNGNDKLYDDEAISRIGRVIDDIKSSISVGGRGIFYCVWPTVSKDMVTTKIKSISTDVNDLTIVETRNSFYYLKKIKELG